MFSGTAFSAINTPTALHETEESPAKRNHLKKGAYQETPIVKQQWFGLRQLLAVMLTIIVVVFILLGTTTPETLLVSYQFIDI